MGLVAAIAERFPSRGVALALVAFLAFTCLAGCAGSPPRDAAVHVVKPGETVYRISRYYGVSVRDVVRANGIRDVSSISIGTRLRIPRASRPEPDRPLALAGSVPAAFEPAGRARAERETDLDFGWPVAGRISSGFGRRGRRRHEGVDIPARKGTPIRAAESGRVIHSGGGLGDYGRVVILKHAGRYQTIYAHNQKNLVRKGEFVEKGQVLGRVGSSGNASGPHLHFEVRRDRKPLDPVRYLP